MKLLLRQILRDDSGHVLFDELLVNREFSTLQELLDYLQITYSFAVEKVKAELQGKGEADVSIDFVYPLADSQAVNSSLHIRVLIQ